MSRPYFEDWNMPVPKGFANWEDVVRMRLQDTLARQPMTSVALAKMLHRPVDEIRGVLVKHFVLKDGKWELKA